VTQLIYTPEELKFLWEKVSAALSKAPTPYFVTPEEDAFLDYLYKIIRVDLSSWNMNEVFNESTEPKYLTILTDPLWKMPLRINDDSLVMRTIAAGRLEIAK
jgi:hypothetical protein